MCLSAATANHRTSDNHTNSYAAVVGDSALMTCQLYTSKKIRWDHTPTNASTSVEFKTIFNGLQMKSSSKYNVTVSANGSTSLVIANVRMNDSGTYRCAAIDSALSGRRFYLVVTGE